jgi:hypothetical protein
VSAALSSRETRLFSLLHNITSRDSAVQGSSRLMFCQKRKEPPFQAALTDFEGNEWLRREDGLRKCKSITIRFEPERQ